MGNKMISKIVSEDINSSTYTEIKAKYADCYGFSILAYDTTTEEMIPFYIAWDDAGDNETFMPASGYGWPDFQPKDSTVCYIKTASGTGKVLLLPARYTSY
jgi:hypothetical protein